MAFFGRTDKYAGFTAAEDGQEYEDHDSITLHEAGPVSWYSKHPVKCVESAGKDLTALLKEDSGLYLLDLEESGKPAAINIFWE